MNEVNLETLSLTKLSEMFGIPRQKMSLACDLAGIRPFRTTNGLTIEVKQFSKRLDEILDDRRNAYDIGLFNERRLSNYLASPRELVRHLDEIGFVKAVDLHGSLFWNSERVRSTTGPNDEDWVPVRAAAVMLGVSIATLSGLVLAGHLPKIMPMNFRPGWDRLAIEEFDESGIDASTFREADEKDILSGRLYPLEEAPPPLHLLGRVATAHAFHGPVGHPLQIADGKYAWIAKHIHLACGARVHRGSPRDQLTTDVEILVELINPADAKY